MIIQAVSEKILFHDTSTKLTDTLTNATLALSGDLSFAKLKGVGNPNLPARHLRISDLTGAQIRECSFSECDLNSARFRGSSILDTLFMDSDLRHVDFSHLSANNAARTLLQQVRFHACALSYANFNGARIEDCVFTFGNEQAGVDFTNTRIKRSDFNDLCFHHLTLDNTQFTTCQFKNIHLIGDLETRQMSKLANCEFSFCNFENMDLSDTRLSHSDFYACNFRNCILTPDTFTHCRYRKAAPYPSSKFSVIDGKNNPKTSWKPLTSGTLSA